MPDPGYPDYGSGIALAGAHRMPLPLDPLGGLRGPISTVCAPARRRSSSSTTRRTRAASPLRPACSPRRSSSPSAPGAVLIHDFAYGDLVFDGRKPESILATPGARDVAVELFTMSKSFGMAGWRLGFVVGNAEVVARVEELQDHLRAGIFMPVQHAADHGAPLRAGGRPRAPRISTRRAATASSPRSPGRASSAPRCEGSYYVWLRLPEGVTATSLLVDHRVALAPGEGFGDGRPRLGAALPLRCGRAGSTIGARAAPARVRLRTTAGRRSAPPSSLSDEARSSSGGPAAAARGSTGGTRRPPRA